MTDAPRRLPERGYGHWGGEQSRTHSFVKPQHMHLLYLFSSLPDALFEKVDIICFDRSGTIAAPGCESRPRVAYETQQSMTSTAKPTAGASIRRILRGS